MAEGVDYAGDRPSSICLKGKGKRFVGRYFGPGGDWKHATKAEVAAHKAAGLAVFALAEGAERDPLLGEPAGRAHAIAADSAVRLAGMDRHMPIYFAVDFDAQPSQYAAIGRYLDGCAVIVGRDRVGVYGGYDIVRWADLNDKARWFFQTYAWSEGRWWSGNHVEQYRNGQTVCGARVDLCRSKKADFGQWPRPASAPPSQPPPPADSTVDTGWDYTRHVDNLATTMGNLASTVDGAARVIESIT